MAMSVDIMGIPFVFSVLILFPVGPDRQLCYCFCNSPCNFSLIDFEFELAKFWAVGFKI